MSYGSACGARAVESLQLVMVEVQIATVRNQVMLNLFTDFETSRGSSRIRVAKIP